MRSRTHASFCDYGMSGAGGAIPCTCGVSETALTADQTIRALALQAAAQPGVSITDVLANAARYETYIRVDVP